jgi:ribosomal protein L18E
MVMKTAKQTHKALMNKAKYMDDEAFAELNEAMEHALAFERRQRRDLNVTRIQASRRPKATVTKDLLEYEKS